MPRRTSIQILSVSRDPKDHQCLESIVSRSSWRLHSATSLQQAWKILHEKTVSVVVTELRFPGGEGSWRAWLEEIAAMNDGPAVIVTTRAPSERTWAEAIRAGVLGVVAKPFDPAEMRGAISMAWQQSRDARVLRLASRLTLPKTAFAGV